MSAPIGPYVPLLIMAVVTWKVANSPSTSSTSTASSTSAYGRPKNPYVNTWGSSISERVSARNARHSRTGSSPRSLAASTGGHGYGHARRGSRPMPLGAGRGVRMSRVMGGVPYGARGPAEGGGVGGGGRR
ncbi:unnamed protein product [Tuber aestivum]|uniref:Uncharacterized protein n=1 Tax=Tuber aestivum TaxID=59557 RepID=A0A292PSV0_9PEZI|nr:unnamed protein product [Tuber aestivum]